MSFFCHICYLLAKNLRRKLNEHHPDVVISLFSRMLLIISAASKTQNFSSVSQQIDFLRSNFCISCLSNISCLSAPFVQ